MKVASGGGHRQSAGFAISDILELNERTAPGLEGQQDPPPYQTHPQDLVVPGQTLLPSVGRHWHPLPPHHELSKFHLKNLRVTLFCVKFF